MYGQEYLVNRTKIVLYVVERYLHSAYTQMNISVSLGGYKIKV